MANVVFTYRAFLNKVKHYVMNEMPLEQLFVERTQNIKQMEAMYTSSNNVLMFMKRLETMAQLEEAGVSDGSAVFTYLGGT